MMKMNDSNGVLVSARLVNLARIEAPRNHLSGRSMEKNLVKLFKTAK